MIAMEELLTDRLTPREREILILVGTECCDYPDVALKLNLSVKTVETHVSSIRKKLHVIRIMEAVKIAVEEGLVRWNIKTVQ